MSDASRGNSQPPLWFRKGEALDQEWLFELFRSTMQEYIEHAWGWDEQIQSAGFKTALPWKSFQILMNENNPAGGYHVSEKDDLLVLDMILVKPESHRKGFGTYMMERIKHSALDRGKHLELNVLHTNPAVEFHRFAGFKDISRDSKSIRMRWQPPA